MSERSERPAAAQQEWGRVDAEGNVYVREGDGERLIAQWVGGDPAEAIALYTRRFEGLQTEVELLEQRMAAGSVAPDDAQKALTQVREQLTDAQAIGDLASLAARLEAIEPQVASLREQRKAEREQRQAESKEAKSRIVAEAEKLSTGNDWRGGADRFRQLLDEWKSLPRLSKSLDDELWHRFSSARTAYTKRRKAHFSEQSARRDEAAKVKERLIAEAESLQESTDWGPTSGRYRDLMQQWKKAGSAPRGVEDKLWKRFRAAQDVFFSARDSANAELDAEYEKNAEVKAELLIEAEALLPIKDLDAARRAWQSIADRWEQAGKVPRARIKEFEGRLRTVENAIRDAGQREWQRTDPEKSARADDMIGKLEAAIAETEAELEKARVAGDEKKVKNLTENLESRRSFLDIARKTASDFG
ncbi:DUF349 domain-containing protein [Aeromicrobium sp. YIM 150415]|uniref:DUF349 domain-containing protein n=1 Tax=Aeromicrobium sp. YIM 150415 TaxID=2803912 RepID=UPI0019652E38|nr:DUF349 domain-containing protein [Aeromicrobium sp. YIM 150415]MBM9464948.1 DUF349 domain-containing protein [Aeromicrobium sp. YIM 150415]